ncbi:MAG: response regulator transcription factor [Lewinellaceae bacterium]|nr:response regulator transcription factor [Lewinellaceae bacterium]
MIQGTKWKILLADDHSVTREGIMVVLRQMQETKDARVDEVGKGADLLPLLKKNGYDLLILDIFLDGVDGLQVLDFIQKESLRISTIIYSRYDNQRMRKAAMIRGAQGFVYKSQPVEEFEKAIRTVLKGRKYTLPSRQKELVTEQPLRSQNSFFVPLLERCSLTKREIQILRLIAESQSNKEIASNLFISEQTVGVHRKNLMRKLGATNKASLIRAAYEFQLLE